MFLDSITFKKFMSISISEAKVVVVESNEDEQDVSYIISVYT